jgi:LPXTG-site transpeptidase (sortase) family protein
VHAKAAKNKNSLARSRVIPVKPEPDFHYSLHIPAAQAPNVVQHVPGNAHKPEMETGSQLSSRRIGRKIWNTLEWLATSALIFMVLFFVMNWGSYSQLLMHKLDQLRGQYSLSPYIQKMLQPSAPASQELLPVAKSPELSKKQIPSLALEIAPPDDRIIIPRINKNVPVVKVKTENLVKRDWGALEKDIQESLQNGVVHYPGTAEAGQHGNVVVTGHSSYFAWDPGRFKDVFALLHEVVIGDQIIVYHDQKKYIYKVYDTNVIMPDEVEVLTQAGGDRLTLITCTPVGTNLKRLVILAKPIV